MQAGNAWIPPGGTLGELVRAVETRVEALRGRKRDLERAANDASTAPSFEGALERARNGGKLAVIAEIKRASPSRGAINPSIDAAAQAAAFARGGAAAISVLTEPDRFRGSADDVIRARATVSLPLLKKDFHTDPIQAVEARAIGASAMLLIARALGPDGLATMAAAARDAGVEILVEVRDEAELEWSLGIDARIIGVNNRNLETLVIDSQAGERIIPLIPPDRIAIAESGIHDVAGARDAAALGADAILVGSSLSSAADPASLILAFSSIPRVARAG